MSAIDTDLVHQFVYDAHNDLDSVKKLLKKEPALVNASWDWGGGDWETALGAAAHTGRKDIAEYLLQRGARIDLFAAAMLGKLEIVKAVVADDPSVIDKRGPHGISLMAHAKSGGKEAAEVVKLLRSTGKPTKTTSKTPKAKKAKAYAQVKTRIERP